MRKLQNISASICIVPRERFWYQESSPTRATTLQWGFCLPFVQGF